MTKQDFIHYLSHPENLNGHSIDSLEKLVQEYPYFQLGRMLYLKNLHNQNSIDYEKNLHVTSAYVPSGKALYNLIKKQVSKEEAGNRQLVRKDSFGAVGNEQKEVEIQADSQRLTVDTKEQASTEVLPNIEPVVIPQKIPVTDKEDASTPLNVTKDEYDELQLLEKEIMGEAYRTSMTFDLLEKKGAENKGQEATEEQPFALNLQPKTSGSYTFNDWLKVVSGKTPESSKNDDSTSLGVARKVKTGIIDNYILEETAKSVSKPKTEFYSAEIMAKKSIQDNETFVTETLARIYLKQGNLPKALRSYEILLVKYPEKIHIFAPLLEKIKKLLKEQKSK